MEKNLKKYDFGMDKIRIFDVFAGIGALHQAHKELGVPTEIVAMSEIEVDAIIDYAAIHIDNFKDLKFEFPSEDEMRNLLMSRNIGFSYEKGKSSIPRLKKEKLYNLYKATILLNNLGDISIIDYDKLPDFDFMNFSFSCTDLSAAGKQKGMKNDDGTPTRSGLYVYGISAIKSKKPKYIMIENVKGLIQKKFINDFYSIIDELNDLGYNCYYPTKMDNKGNKIPMCLNTKNFGVPQNRERIFVYCIRKDLDDNNFEFNYGFESDVRLKDFLEINVDPKYYLSDMIQERFKFNGSEDVCRNELNIVGSSAPNFRTIGQRDITYGVNGVMSTLTATDYKQPKQILTNDIHVIGSTLKEGDTKFAVVNRVYNDGGIAPTLDTMQGGNREPKIIGSVDCNNDKPKFKIRKLTPKECWRLQGFRDECFDRAKEMGTSDSMLYKQAGNSITVDVIYWNLFNLYKNYLI